MFRKITVIITEEQFQFLKEFQKKIVAERLSKGEVVIPGISLAVRESIYRTMKQEREKEELKEKGGV